MHQRLTKIRQNRHPGPNARCPQPDAPGRDAHWRVRWGARSRTTALHRADIGHHGAPALRCGADLLGDFAAGADRSADDDQIGAVNCGGVCLEDLVADAELRRCVAASPRTGHVAAISRTSALCACRPRDRRADQADADQRQAVEERCGFGHSITPAWPEIREARQRRAGSPLRCRRSCAAHSAAYRP